MNRTLILGSLAIFWCIPAIETSAETASASPTGSPPAYAPGTVYSPVSNMRLANEAGKIAHTNLKVLVPPVNAGPARLPPVILGTVPHTGRAQSVYPFPGYFYDSPASLACIYQLVSVTVPGCDPDLVSTNTTTGSRAIAVVDAYDYPAALSDLTKFSSQFGLPAPTSSNFQVVYATGTKPANGGGSGWDLEAALDIEYAHGLAPNAKIYLVEAASDSFSDMFVAVAKASQLVAAAGGGEVSMSWGGNEFSSETAFDSQMTTRNVVYFAAAGDSAGTGYPCVSPNVVCVGGTGTSRNPLSGKFEGEIAWVDSGGGFSVYEARPAYQNVIAGITGTKRGVPDVAAVADPRTGVWVYNTTYVKGDIWFVVGGTSVASPVMAGIINSSGSFYASSSSQLSAIYSTVGSVGAGWNDVTDGACGYYDGFAAVPGWDPCTGVGTPRGVSFKVAR